MRDAFATAGSAVRRGYKRFRSVANRVLPKGLFARSLLIIVMPMVLLQSVITLVFMERHWDAVTRKLSDGVVRDVAALIDIVKTYPHVADYGEMERIGNESMGLIVKMLPPAPCPNRRASRTSTCSTARSRRPSRARSSSRSGWTP